MQRAGSYTIIASMSLETWFSEDGRPERTLLKTMKLCGKIMLATGAIEEVMGATTLDNTEIVTGFFLLGIGTALHAASNKLLPRFNQDTE